MNRYNKGAFPKQIVRIGLVASVLVAVLMLTGAEAVLFDKGSLTAEVKGDAKEILQEWHQGEHDLNSFLENHLIVDYESLDREARPIEGLMWFGWLDMKNESLKEDTCKLGELARGDNSVRGCFPIDLIPGISKDATSISAVKRVDHSSVIRVGGRGEPRYLFGMFAPLCPESNNAFVAVPRPANEKLAESIESIGVALCIDGKG